MPSRLRAVRGEEASQGKRAVYLLLYGHVARPTNAELAVVIRLTVDRNKKIEHQEADETKYVESQSFARSTAIAIPSLLSSFAHDSGSNA